MPSAPPPLETLPHELDRSNMTCQVVVEAPASSRVKVYYDPESHRFRVGKFLPLGMCGQCRGQAEVAPVTDASRSQPDSS